MIICVYNENDKSPIIIIIPISNPEKGNGSQQTIRMTTGKSEAGMTSGMSGRNAGKQSAPSVIPLVIIFVIIFIVIVFDIYHHHQHY